MPPSMPEPYAQTPDRLLVFIPAYNCAPQIGRVLAQFASVPGGLFDEILVVDNRSTDGTAEAALSASAGLHGIPVTVVRNCDNYGLGGSHKSAFAYAEAEGFTHVIVLHGDDQGRIADVLPVLARGDHHRYAVCLGSRFMRGSRLKGYKWTRTMGNRVFNALFSLVSRRRVTDLGSGLNVFSRQVFANPFLQRYSDDLRFNCYLLLGLIDAGMPLQFFPITWSEEDQISNVKIVSQSMKTLEILIEFLFSRSRFRAGEHRATPRNGYVFDVVGSNAALPEPARMRVAR